MKYSENYVTERNVNVVTIEIYPQEMVGVKRTEAEMKHMVELSKSNRVSDKILAIQIMARKIEEA